MVLDLNSLGRLQNDSHSELLDIIDELRSYGLSDFLPLPQLIVCGDQSSGKSSVLEAISGVPFPRKDQLCTRFATEVILRRNEVIDELQARVSIIPGAMRTDAEKKELAKFKFELEDMQEIPQIMERAKEAMGLDSNGAFSTDVLRLDICGPRVPQLTIVDLPGLIHSETRYQTAEDVRKATELVNTYMAQERSIILAVVSAKNDYANQIVLKKARKFDKEGTRTLGIITKPDTLAHGSGNETAYIDLARNHDVYFQLGWHVLCNLDSGNPSTATMDRDSMEQRFFDKSSWKALDATQTGIRMLRHRLSTIQFEQIQRELPNLIKEIREGLEDCQTALGKLGKSRDTEGEKRIYLSEIGQSYYDLCKAGCDGEYEHPFFSSIDQRIRAFVQKESIDFTSKMMLDGSSMPLPESLDEELNPAREGEAAPDAHAEAVKLAQTLIKDYRGRELPGTFNPLHIGLLFQKYSSKWKSEGRDHVEKIYKACTTFVSTILKHVADESSSSACYHKVLEPQLEAVRGKAMEKLDELMTELTRHPITYNHELREVYEKIQNRRRVAILRDKLHAVFQGREGYVNAEEVEKVLALVEQSYAGDMDKAAAEDMVSYMLAYYKICLKRLIDSVPSSVIEPFLMEKLPKLFGPPTALTLDRAVVDDIAGEDETQRLVRAKLETKLAALQAGERTCKRYAARLPDPTLSRKPLRRHDSGKSFSGSEADAQNQRVTFIPATPKQQPVAGDALADLVDGLSLDAGEGPSNYRSPGVESVQDGSSLVPPGGGDFTFTPPRTPAAGRGVETPKEKESWRAGLADRLGGRADALTPDASPSSARKSGSVPRRRRAEERGARLDGGDEGRA